MREKKYRVWAGGKMHFPDIITFDAAGAVFSPADTGGGSWRAEYKDVSEPTGLRDKLGCEIYEGDVVHSDNNMTVFVKWDNDDAVFCCRDIRDKFCATWTLAHFWLDGLIVIGNIHANPDLLK